jgi:hypothetical protein
MLMENEFIEIFEKVGIPASIEDLKFLKFYHSQQKSANTGTVSIVQLLNFSNITDRLDRISDQITDQLSSKHVKCNKCMSASQYTFKDLIRFFKRVDLNLNYFSERFLSAAQ